MGLIIRNTMLRKTHIFFPEHNLGMIIRNTVLRITHIVLPEHTVGMIIRSNVLQYVADNTYFMSIRNIFWE